MAKANGSNAELMKSPSKRMVLKSNLDKLHSEIAMSLPVHLKNNAKRYARQLMTLYSSNEYLRRCTLPSLLGSLMTASALGLDLSPQLGQCYIIPYKDQAQFQLGYKGMINLAYRSGQVKRVFADVVREKDHFVYSKGLHAKLEHEEADGDEEERGNIMYAYALAEFVNGGYAFEVWRWSRVMGHAKKFSQAYNKSSSPWKSDPEAMGKKTMIKAIWKYLPISTDIQWAASSDASVRSVNESIRAEAEILDSPNEMLGEDVFGESVIEALPEPEIDAEFKESQLPLSDTNGAV